jgi:hypothetical protein
MHAYIHILPAQCVLEVIRDIINEHAPIGANLANEVGPIDMLQPGTGGKLEIEGKAT